MFKYYDNEDETHKLITTDSTLPIDRPHSVNQVNLRDEIRFKERDFALSPFKSNEENLSDDRNDDDNDNDDDDDDDTPLNPFKMPINKLKIVLWAIFLPINILFFLTVPDTRRKTFSRFPWYFLSFFISTVYLAVFTYLLVWMVVIIGG